MANTIYINYFVTAFLLLAIYAILIVYHSENVRFQKISMPIPRRAVRHFEGEGDLRSIMFKGKRGGVSN